VPALGLAVLTAAVLAAILRAASRQGVTAWDAWAFWVPKAKAIYFFGGLDEHLFRTLPNPSYPLLVPALQALDFRVIGAANATALALQYWFLLVGFVLAAWALLRPVARSVVVWSFLGLVTVTPELDRRILSPQADWPLDILFALAALCLTRWVCTREAWLVGAYGALLAGALATKREGQLLAACLVAAALAATWRSAAASWPPILAASALAYVLNVPWRIWWESRGLVPDTPPSSLHELGDTAARAAPSFRIVADRLVAPDLWLLAVPLGAALAIGLLLCRRSALAWLFLGTSGLAFVGLAWALWATPNWPLNTSQQTPIPRAAGSLVLLSLVLAPLFVEQLLRPAPGARGTR
jgi:hypothetical protein